MISSFTVAVKYKVTNDPFVVEVADLWSNRDDNNHDPQSKRSPTFPLPSVPPIGECAFNIVSIVAGPGSLFSVESSTASLRAESIESKRIHMSRQKATLDLT